MRLNSTTRVSRTQFKHANSIHDCSDENTIHVLTEMGVFIGIVAAVIMSITCQRDSDALLICSGTVKLSARIAIPLYQTNIT